MGESDASGMDDRREEFAMLRHLAREDAGLAPSMGSTTLKKAGIQRRIPTGCSVKAAEAQRSRSHEQPDDTESWRGKPAVVTWRPTLLHPLLAGLCVRFPYYDNSNSGR